MLRKDEFHYGPGAEYVAERRTGMVKFKESENGRAICS